jgi:hypothetical protein
MKYKKEKERKRESKPAFWTEQHSLVHLGVSIDPSFVFLDVITEVDFSGLNNHFHWAFPLRHTH